ncbi:cell cycle checkpoint control protein rad9a [Cichlidogyrus casuarinus]|uniref:Cell cycle checkpoint control protein rad9a n=1 Tax=Cichlidogyrus casuarinus TaxID=1844966 RepID=A0ABD2Q851_9PLAT
MSTISCSRSLLLLVFYFRFTLNIFQSLCKTLRSALYEDSELDYCQIRVAKDYTFLVIEFFFSHDISLQYRISCMEILKECKAIYDKNACANQISINKSLLSDVLSNFNKSMSELTIHLSQKDCKFQNVPELFKPSEIAQTQVCISADDFDSFTFSKSTSFTLCYREFKAIMSFWNILTVSAVKIYCDEPASPLIVVFTDDLIISGEFVFATAPIDQPNNSVPSQEAKQKPITLVVSSPMECQVGDRTISSISRNDVDLDEDDLIIQSLDLTQNQMNITMNNNECNQTKPSLFARNLDNDPDADSSISTSFDPNWLQRIREQVNSSNLKRRHSNSVLVCDSENED